MLPSHAGSEASGPVLFSGVSQISTEYTEGSGDCESGSHYIAQFQVRLTQDKITESVCVPDFTDTKTSGLAAIFLSGHSTGFSRVPASGLKEFYCSPKYNMLLSGPCNN
jgi:hypothetical protein